MKLRLLLYLAHASDVQRFAVAPALAALTEHAGDGWRFDCVFDAPRDGRHFGAGDPDVFGPSAGNGSLLAGSAYAEQLLWLTTAYDVAAVGDAAATAWPALDAAGAEALCRSRDPAAIYEAVLARLDVGHVPRRLVVVDGGPQGRHRVVTAPYLLPAAFVDGPALAVDVSTAVDTAKAVAALLPTAARPPLALYVDPARAGAFPIELAEREGAVADATYADVTAELCRRHMAWGRGVLLGDPNLVASQTAKAARLRLVPIHGRPQVDVLERVDDVVLAATEPVYGRQWDDRDFFALARAGHGLQVVDPPPPLDSTATVAPSFAGNDVHEPSTDEPSDDQLAAWAGEGRVLTTLLLWAGMIREADCYPAIVDLLAATRLRAGVVVTVDAVTHAPPASLALLDAPADRGGVRGQAELVVGSTGFGVAAEAELPDGALAQHLGRARRELADLLPESLQPRAWWPLLDTTLHPHRAPRVTRAGWRPIVHVDPARRSIVNAVIHRTKAYRFVEARRPYDGVRPGAIAPAVLDAVKHAGFDHMWTKAGFGTSRVVHADGEFVALPFTAGNWDGWSPFYTVSSVADVTSAERRATRTRQPGWLVSTVDSPLWLLTGERHRHGSWLHDVAARLVAGGRSGRLVNTSPSAVARYARLLARR